MPTQTFSITASSNDAESASTSSATYSSLAYSGTSLTTETASVARHLGGGSFLNNLMLCKWDTSSLPDGAVIDSAVVRLYAISKFDADGRSIVGDYRTWTGVSADWTLTAPASPILSKTIASISTGTTNDISITDLSGISTTDATYIRFHISGGQPTGSNTVNIAQYDNISSRLVPQLIVTYHVGPTANFTHTTSPGSASFTDTSTPAPGTTIASRSWTFGDTTSGTGTPVTHNYGVGGTFSVTLTVTDSNGISNSITQSVTVPPPAANVPPTAYFTASSGALTVNFTDASSDPDNAIVAWAWTFGDGGTSTSQNPSHTYAATGTYTVSLTVTDTIGATNTYSRSITVRTAGSANSYVAGPIFLRESTLTEDIDSTQTTIPVAELAYWPPNGALWPPNNEGMLDPEGAAEKITWTAKSATHGPGNLTGVTRGAFGTTAASHSADEIIGLFGRHDAGLAIKRKAPLFPVNASLTLQELRRHFDSERFAWADLNNLNESARLEITGAPTSTGNVSTTLDEGGTAVQRNAGVTAAKEVRSLTISTSATASGNVAITLNDTARNVSISATVAEKQQLVLSGTVVYNGSFAIQFYNASNVLQTANIPVSNGQSAETVANAIRATSFSGWIISGSGTTIVATATTTGPRGPAGAGQSGSFKMGGNPNISVDYTVLQEGTSSITATEVAAIIRATSFPAWITGGTGSTVTFTALEPSVRSGTYSYSAGVTGATSASGVTQTTAGTQSTPAQVATAIRALYSGNTYWTVGGSGAIVTWDATSSGAKLDATFTPGTTGTVGNMQTVHQGSTDIVGYLSDSGGIEQTRRLLGNLATTTEFNLETSVSGSGTTKGIISFWGSFGTDPLELIWRVENLDLTDFPVGEAAYGVTSESSSGLTWDVRSDEVEPTTRGKSYYRDHNLQGNLLGQLYYYGLLEPEQAREDIFVQELWQPVQPGLEISLAFWMRYENLPASFPCKPLFITFHHIDGTITEVGDASGLTGLSGDANWDEYELTLNAPTLEENPVPAYWMHVRSRNMSQGNILIQEIVPSLGPVAKRTPYYAFEGTFKAQLDLRTPKPGTYLQLGRKRLELETQYDANGGTVSSQYRSADDPTSFDGTWYEEPTEVPDRVVIDAESTLTGDGLSTPEVLSGYPRAEYLLYAGIKPHSVLLLKDRTEMLGGVLAIMDEWYPDTGVNSTTLPSGRVRRAKTHEPVGRIDEVQFMVFKAETTKYIREKYGTEEFVIEARTQAPEILTVKLLSKPEFSRETIYAGEGESRGSYWISEPVAAEVLSASGMLA